MFPSSFIKAQDEQLYRALGSHRVAKPKVTVIVVNWNGQRFLGECFSSLRAVNYPRECYEVVMVDNGSSDGSVPFVKAQFPWVRVIEARRNLGFARGNNLGIRESGGDYVILLNNDTRVEPEWLGQLVDAVEGDPRVGICASKILLARKRFAVRLETTSFVPASLGLGPDGRDLGVRVAAEADVDGEQVAVDHLAGFHGWESDGLRRFRWSGATGTIGIPVAGDVVRLFALQVAGVRGLDGASQEFALYAGDVLLGKYRAEADFVTRQIAVPTPLQNAVTNVIQSAGTVILRQGLGRDRGATVCGTDQNYQSDVGQYDTAQDVFAACGASMLLRRSMLEDVGLLDERFFMYYEDLDLAWRARLRGWNVLYVPASVVYHVHCGSSGEWSPFFTYNVERNWLATVLKSGSSKQVVGALRHYGAENIRRSAACAQALRQGRLPDRAITTRLAISARVLAALASLLPSLLLRRLQIQRGKRVSPREVESWMCDER